MRPQIHVGEEQDWENGGNWEGQLARSKLMRFGIWAVVTGTKRGKQI